MPVLAVLAMKIAPDPAERIRSRPGKKVIQRFFFNRVDGFRTDAAERRGVQYAGTVLSYPANPERPVFYPAPVAAQGTLHKSIFGLLVPERLMHASSQYVESGRRIIKVMVFVFSF
jgi:hypothetical protein